MKCRAVLCPCIRIVMLVAACTRRLARQGFLSNLAALPNLYALAKPSNASIMHRRALSVQSFSGSPLDRTELAAPNNERPTADTDVFLPISGRNLFVIGDALPSQLAWLTQAQLSQLQTTSGEPPPQTVQTARQHALAWLCARKRPDVHQSTVLQPTCPRMCPLRDRMGTLSFSDEVR